MFRWLGLFSPEKPKINYLWIGHPPLSNKTEQTVIGQDIKDVLEMAKICENPIYFYCLDDYLNHYEKAFKGTKVNVLSMDAYVRKMRREGNKDIRGFAEKILQIQLTVLTPPRGKVIDFVSLKEVFSLFILATQGGYTLDSNVHPAKDASSIELPDFPHFKAPYTGPMIEIWMMYASPAKLDEPQKMLKAYLAGWDKVQAMLEINPEPINENEEHNVSSVIEYPKLYHQFIIDLTVGSVESVYLPSFRTDQNWEFTIDVGEAQYEAKCKGLQIGKSYGNSHKHNTVYAKNQARFDLDRKSSFLEDRIKKEFSESKFGLNFMQDRETQAFEEEILQFIKLEENRVPEKIIAKLQVLSEDAQKRYGTENLICGFKRTVDAIIEAFHAEFPNRLDKEKSHGFSKEI